MFLVIDVDCATVGVSSMENYMAIDVIVADPVAIDDVTGGTISVVVDIDSMAINDDSLTRGANSIMVDIDPVAVGAASGGGSKGVESSGAAVMGILSNTFKLCAIELMNMIILSEMHVQGG